MADTYDVQPDEIAAELSLYPDGFAVSTKPSIDQVRAFISDADTVVTLHMQRATGVAPLASDDNARLAKRYVMDAVLGRVMRMVYAANDPREAAAAASPYESQAKDMLERIDALEKATTVASSIGWASVPSGSTPHAPSW